MEQIDRTRVKELTSTEAETFQARTRESLGIAQRAVEVLPLGVPSSVFALSPYPLTVTQGRGAEIWDVDGNNYVDYGNGYGTEVFGHAHPLITEAIHRRAADGVHFGALSEEAVEWGELMCRRFGLNWIRFSPSGTEATLDALRLARALTGRKLIAKIEGAYHGSHPWVMASTQPGLEDGRAGLDDAPLPVAFGEGVDDDVLASLRILPFNDFGVAERVLASGEIAALIVEPILFNVGAIFPAPGYLAHLRELCTTYGTQLIFDEVKTGVSVSYDGAAGLFGVQPDLKTFGKGIGGGLGVGAIGGMDEDGYLAIESWRAPHLGTFAGNPLSAAAGIASLRDVMTPQAHDQLEQHRLDLANGLDAVIGEHQLPAYVTGAGAKNCVVWADPDLGRLRNYRDYARRFDGEMGYLAWIWMANRGVWLTPGRDEQTTHSIQHGDGQLTRFVEAFAGLGAALRS